MKYLLILLLTISTQTMRAQSYLEDYDETRLNSGKSTGDGVVFKGLSMRSDLGIYSDSQAMERSLETKEIKEQRRPQDFAFPNPCTDYAYINFNQEIEGSVKLQLLDIEGNLIQTMYEDKNSVRGMKGVRLNLIGIHPGTYDLKLITPGNKQTQKLIKI